MPRKGQFRPRRGFARVPGKSRSYRDLGTGEIISKREYTKRTEKVRSLEVKADAYKIIRRERGVPEPMQRYNAIVAQYKLTHGVNAKVRGKGAESFQHALHVYTKKHRKRDVRSNLSRIRARETLGLITHEQAEALRDAVS